MCYLKKNLFYFILIILSSCISFSYAESKNIKTKKINFPISNIKFIESDKIYYNHNEKFFEAEGDVNLLDNIYRINSNKILYDFNDRKIFMSGGVRIYDPKIIYHADNLYFDINNRKAVITNLGVFVPPSTYINASFGSSDKTGVYNFKNVKCSPCSLYQNKDPIWQIRANDMTLDFNEENINLKKGYFEFFGKKIFYVPFFSYPMPKAKSRSGVLIPSMNNSRIDLPIYYSIKPNMDLTYTPSFNNRDFVNKIEFRHLINSGSYNVNTSFTLRKSKNLLVSKDNFLNKSTRYYFIAKGDFKNDNDLNYGIQMESISDKLYLKNYFDEDKDFTKSEVYLSKFDDYDYKISKIQSFKDIRFGDSLGSQTMNIPDIAIKKHYFLDNGLNLSIINNSIVFISQDKTDIFRNNFTLNLYKNFYSKNGDIFSLGIYNRADLYRIFSDHRTNIKGDIDKLYLRNIPELHVSYRKPFFASIIGKYNMIIEPRVFGILGAKSDKKVGKYTVIDSPNRELNEYNIFSNNRYSGMDYHEYGTRLGYGINSIVNFDDFIVDGFVGQFLQSDKGASYSKSDYVGKISLNYEDFIEVYYRFQRKHKKFARHRDEFTIWYKNNRFSISNSFVSLKDLTKYKDYYNISREAIENNKISQLYSNVNYSLNDYWGLFSDFRIDLSKRGKAKSLSKSFGVKYEYDCIGFLLKYSNNNTIDSYGKLKNKKNLSFVINLKTINM